ncbi:unnamed protein product [Rotaria sp. Silwood2]|nr:unnamed protein product [Rotaria sp. Silwood2]CAF4317666.1 unnamed protein product [Rotaria sp. Silwood2]
MFIFNHNNFNVHGSKAVYYEGIPVVDLWNGWFDESKSKPNENDKLQISFSTTKVLLATAVASSVQRKNTIIADFLSHRAGLPSDISSFEVRTSIKLESDYSYTRENKTEWTPGTAHGYDGLTYTWLTGELVQRVDPKKRTFGQFIQDEITNPLKIEFYFGLSKEKSNRVSSLYFDSNVCTILSRTTVSELTIFNDYLYHQAEISSVNEIPNI